jgi:prepilin-type N-terminal cleavage/methylation domain-containing protein
MRPDRRRARRGFTFVELLIALTIFSIVAVSVYSVFRAGIRLWKANDEAYGSRRAARFFFDTLSSDLRNSFIYPGVDVTAGADTISFMTIETVGSASGGPSSRIALVRYKIDAGSRRVTRVSAGAEELFEAANAEPSEFTFGEGEAGFSYCFVSKTELAAYEWRDAWTAKDRMPRGVRVRFGRFDRWISVPIGELGSGD